ncbi:MAG TPA: ATP-binding protein [Longimicrobium sp.]
MPPAMHTDPLQPLYEPARLAELDATGLLDTASEESFDRITRLAAEFLAAPLSLVNFVDDRRQFAKSCFAPAGWTDAREAPLADSYCKWAVATGETLAIDDAREDPRVTSSAMLREANVRSYLGVPLAVAGGHVLGTLCVADFQPRHWSERDARVLADLAASVVTEIQLRLDIRRRGEVERIKDELVSVVSHELRTPLTSIRGSLGLLASGKLGPLSPQGARMVQIATQNAERLVRLISDTLDLERLESGSMALERAWADADAVALRAVETLRGMAEECGVRLEAGVPASLAMWVDADRLEQVLVNLLSNAIKFSPAGSVVRLTAERRGGEVLFAVIDRGRGIPEAQLEHVFERFRQVDSSDAREKGGTGLGLAICRSIVHQHGGRIWAASEVGAGSTFFFTLPVEERK